MTPRRLLAVLALAAAALALPARAAPVIGLSLVIDESGSITAADFSAQRIAYVNALDRVLQTDGSVAIGVLMFSGDVREIFPVTTIDSPAKKQTLLNTMNGVFQRGGSTATGLAIETAAQRLLRFFAPFDPERLVIDVSTDGVGNVGPTEEAAAAGAIAAGIDQVNVLCIGAAANCTFNRGVGSFNVPATFANVEEKLQQKLEIELAPVPEPGTYLLLLAGIAMIAVAARKRC